MSTTNHFISPSHGEMASENPFSVLDLTYAIIETYPPSIRFPYSYPSVTSELIGPVRAISRLCCTPNMWPTYFTRLVKDRFNFSLGRVNKPHARRRSGAGSSWPPIQKYFHSGIRSCMRYRMHLAVVRAPVMQRRLCSWSAHDHLIKFVILVRQVQGRFSGDRNLEKLQSRYIYLCVAKIG